MRILKTPTYTIDGTTVELTIQIDRSSLREVTAFIDTVKLDKDMTLTADVKRTIPSEKVKKMSWVLIDKLAHKLRASKSEIHESMLERYGAISRSAKGEPMVFEVREDVPTDELKAVLGNHIFEVDEGNGYKTVKVVKSTNEMDNVEFAAYLDGIISECQELGLRV